MAHNHDSVGATPTSATNLPKRESGVANRLLAKRTFVYGRGRECDRDTGGDCKGLHTPSNAVAHTSVECCGLYGCGMLGVWAHIHSLGVAVARQTLTL